jgi:hypothetical protein
VKSSFGWDIARVTPVAARTFTPPQFAGTQAPVIGHGLELIGEEAPTRLQAGQPVSVVLHWRVNAPQPADIFSVAQLLSLDYGLYGNSDHHTLGYLYPSARWLVGDIIPDFHQINVSANQPQGVFRWAAGAHVPPDARRLSVTPPNSGLNDLWLWGAVRNPPPVAGMLPASMTTLDAHFADHIMLAGYCLDNASDTWTLTLFWQVDAPPQGDYTIFVHALLGDQIVAQHDSRPDNGQLPTWSWSPGEVITTAYTLNIPPGVRPDALYVGMYAYPSLDRLAVTQNGTADNRVYIATSQLLNTTR